MSAPGRPRLRGAGPPPVLDVITSLLKAWDAKFMVELIEALGGLSEDFRPPVTLALSQVWQGGDPSVRRAIVDTVLVVGPAQVEPEPKPAGVGPTSFTSPLMLSGS